MTLAGPFTVAPGGIRLAVRLTPRADRTAVDGVVSDKDGRLALHVRVAAPPVEGAANKALIAFLCGVLRVRKSAIVIQSGATARTKMLHLGGDPVLLATALTRLIEQTRNSIS